MKKTKILFLTLVSAMLLGWSSSAVAMPTYCPIDITAFCNTRIIQANYGFPEGMGQILGGVPFDIPVGQNNAWWSDNGTPWSLSQITIPVNIFGVQEVHSLINTGWGMTGGPYTWLEFYGTNGAYFKKDLYGDVDIRGWQYDDPKWTTNSILSPTIQVWANTRQHVDKQLITLPDIFTHETLLNIVMSDAGAANNGSWNSHRAYLEGLTVAVNPVPEPSSMLLLSMGLMAAGFFRKKKKA